jgi:hypothetical protein
MNILNELKYDTSLILDCQITIEDLVEYGLGENQDIEMVTKNTCKLCRETPLLHHIGWCGIPLCCFSCI